MGICEGNGEHSLADTLSMVESPDSNIGKELRKVQIYAMTKEDRALRAELKTVGHQQHEDGGLKRITDMLEGDNIRPEIEERFPSV